MGKHHRPTVSRRLHRRPQRWESSYWSQLKKVLITKMEKREVIVGVIDVGTFLETVLDYIRTLDPKTGKAVTGNEEANPN